MSTEYNLDELERLEKAATAGPWVNQHNTDGSIWDHKNTQVCTLSEFDERPEDFEAIAALRNAAPALIRIAKAAQALVDAPRDEWGEPGEPAHTVEVHVDVFHALVGAVRGSFKDPVQDAPDLVRDMRGMLTRIEKAGRKRGCVICGGLSPAHTLDCPLPDLLQRVGE